VQIITITTTTTTKIIIIIFIIFMPLGVKAQGLKIKFKNTYKSWKS